METSALFRFNDDNLCRLWSSVPHTWYNPVRYERQNLRFSCSVWPQSWLRRLWRPIVHRRQKRQRQERMCHDSYNRYRDQSTSLCLLSAWELLPEPQTLRQISLKCLTSRREFGHRWFISDRLRPNYHKRTTIVHWFNLESRRWMDITRPKWASFPMRPCCQKFLQWYLRAL